MALADGVVLAAALFDLLPKVKKKVTTADTNAHGILALTCSAPRR